MNNMDQYYRNLYKYEVDDSACEDGTCKAGPYYNTQWLTGC